MCRGHASLKELNKSNIPRKSSPVTGQVNESFMPLWTYSRPETIFGVTGGGVGHRDGGT